MIFKEEILKVSNEYALTLFTPYVKKDTLFTENSSDDDSDNKGERDDISLNLIESNENKANDSRTFTQNGTNIAEWMSPTM
jgi:hypothetical protein